MKLRDRVRVQRGTDSGYVVNPGDPWMYYDASRRTLTITVKGAVRIKLTSLRPRRTDGQPVTDDDWFVTSTSRTLSRHLENEQRKKAS